MVNVAVVGYGFAGRCFHTYLANLAEGMSIYAISTRDQTRQEQAKVHYPMAKIYTSLDQVLDD